MPSGNKMRGQEKAEPCSRGIGQATGGTPAPRSIWPKQEGGFLSGDNGALVSFCNYAMCWSPNNVSCDKFYLAYATRFKECCYLLSDHKT